MEITTIGAVLIPLGILFFVAAPDLLYWCAVFFVPFSATAVINVGSGESYSGLQAWMFFGALWLAREASNLTKTRGEWYRDRIRLSVRALFLFVLVALLSLVMPLWIDGAVWIQSPVYTLSESHPLFFSMEHLTQFLYLSYGAVFAIFLAAKNTKRNQFLRTVKIFLVSSIFVTFWGALEWACDRWGLTYPAFLFNTNKNEAAMGYMAQFSDLGIARISSVATEPSMLAQYLLIVLVFGLFAAFSNRPVISKFWDRTALLLALLILLLTTSSTAYVGLTLLVPALLVGFTLLGRLRARYAVMLLGLLSVACIAVYSWSNWIQDFAELLIFSKAGSYSGLERLNSVVLAQTYFLRYPILGLGWGSVTSHDLIFKLLSNTGIIGLFSFGLFVWSVGAGLWKCSGVRGQDSSYGGAYWGVCMIAAIYILIVTNSFTEFAFVFGHLWFVLGMGLAVPGVAWKDEAFRIVRVKQALA